MKIFECRMVGFDEINEWHDVYAWGVDEAAKKYAVRCDDASGGDLFVAVDHEIEVRWGESGNVHRFTIELQLEKAFCVQEIREGKAA